MHLARVIGSVVATKKDKRLTGVKLLVIQPITSQGKDKGSPIVAADSRSRLWRDGILRSKQEGAAALPNPNACVDAGIIGIVDSVYAPAADKGG